MNSEAFDIVNRVVQRNYLLLAAVARARIHLPYRQRAPEQAVDGRFDPLAGILGACAAGGRLQRGVAAIGMERVFGVKNEVAAISGRKLEMLGHAHWGYLLSAGGRGLLAFAAKDAATVIHGDRKSTRLNSSHANISYAVFCL